MGSERQILGLKGQVSGLTERISSLRGLMGEGPNEQISYVLVLTAQKTNAQRHSLNGISIKLCLML